MNALTPNGDFQSAEPVAQVAAPQPAVDLEKYTTKYVQLRDLIKEREAAFKKELAPAKEMLERLNGMLLDHLNRIGVDSVSSGGGTVYRTTHVSVTMPDPGAFREFVIENAEFDLADIRPNKTAVTDWLEEKAALPPGVNYTTSYEVGVRRGKDVPPAGAAPQDGAAAPDDAADAPDATEAAPRRRGGGRRKQSA